MTPLTVWVEKPTASLSPGFSFTKQSRVAAATALHKSGDAALCLFLGDIPHEAHLWPHFLVQHTSACKQKHTNNAKFMLTGVDSKGKKCWESTYLRTE